MKYDLKRVYEICFAAIGGEENEDVKYLRRKREQGVVRNNFFGEAAWAILVSGVSRKAAETFSRRAGECGFDWDYRTTAARTDEGWREFFTRLYPAGISGRGQKKWAAIRHVAERLAALPDEAAFQRAFFAGKTRSVELDDEDVRRLFGMGLPFIGYANSQYIVRNMGGEAIKCDRWLTESLAYFEVSGHKLREELTKADISLSLFDMALWGYCERHVVRVADFRQHFDTHFAPQARVAIPHSP